MPFTLKRYDASGVIRFMAEAQHYVMVRRPHCYPFVLPKAEWDALSSEPLAAPSTDLSRGKP